MSIAALKSPLCGAHRQSNLSDNGMWYICRSLLNVVPHDWVFSLPEGSDKLLPN